MSRLRLPLAAWLLPLLLAAAGYSGALQAGFVSDDYEMLHSAQRASDGWSAFTLRSEWDRAWFRPFGVWSFWAQLQAAGLAGWSFHAFNLAVHVANSVLLGRLVARVTRLDSAGLAASLLFAAHPLHAEAVTWVSGRFDLLSTLGVLIALVAWLRFAADGRRRDLALVLGGVLLALASKENGVLAPLWILAVTLAARISWTRQIWRAWFLVGAVTFAWMILRAVVVAEAGGNLVPATAGFSAQLELARIPRYVAQAVLACVVPSTGRSSAELLAPSLWIFSAGIAIAIAVAARDGSLRATLSSCARFGALFLIAILPYAALGSRLYPDLQGARYLYFASVFSCAALAMLLGAPLASPTRGGARAAWLAALIVLGAQIVATRQVNARWVEAGAQARRIVADFPQCERSAGAIYVSDLPETFEGAYVFRNAFHIALQVERGCEASVLYGPAPSQQEPSLRWDTASQAWFAIEKR